MLKESTLDTLVERARAPPLGGVSFALSEQ
jgi:hypothetical protein